MFNCDFDTKQQQKILKNTIVTVKAQRTIQNMLAKITWTLPALAT